MVKAVKDPAVPRDDTYKSSTIHTGPGEPPSSVSRPTPRAKQVAARPVNKGKLLRPGGPNGAPSKLSGGRPNGTASRPTPRAVPQPKPQPAAAAHPRIVPQPVAAVAPSHNRTESQTSVRAPPPPPPPAAAPVAPQKPTAKALYDFSSDRSNELTIHAGQVVQIISKEGNGWCCFHCFHRAVSLTRYIGWWLCMNVTSAAQGWAPEAYLEEQAVAAAPRPAPPPPPPAPKAVTNGTASAAAAKAKPTPPAPPAKRPAAARKPLAPPARDSAVSLASHDSSGGSGRATPNSVSNASLAGGLAEALRQREHAMRGAPEVDEW